VSITDRLRAFLQKNKIGKNILVLLVTFGATIGLAILLSYVNNDNKPFSMAVFIMAVVIVTRFTDGYIWGIVSALIGTFCVNNIFKYPPGTININFTGYLLTFTVMLIVSVLISTLTTQIKHQERLRFDIEREKMYSNLLRAIAHDLRTPLTAIIGASSTIQEQQLSAADQISLAEGIRKDAEWLVRVTENLLSVTRVSNYSMIKKEDEVLEEIIGSAIMKYHRLPDSLPVDSDTLRDIILVPMDAMLIEQVMINLFDNVNAHAEGASKIWIHLRHENGMVFISVEDDGCGIPASLLPQILDGTYLSKRSRSDDRRSMGIGLSVCRSIIEAHEGQLFAGKSRHGGAAFEFSLPCKEDTYVE
jgi:two-component system sensor histidine kinase KdpD